MSAAWIGAGWLCRASDKLLGRLILRVALGQILIADGLFVAAPARQGRPGTTIRVRVAAQEAILSRDRAQGLSALDIPAGRITDIRWGWARARPAVP